ncbi:MAG: hypothetical protein NDJ89_16275 [Oligoflexia bacterium]|nr:hypothetical protein [Oligoflexia bacterium]
MIPSFGASFSALLLVFGMASTAFADPCARLYSQILLVGERPPKLTDAQYRAYLDGMRRDLEGFKSPDFGLYLGIDDPAYVPQANSVYAPSNLFRSATSGKEHPANYELALLDHEIGHALYETNFPHRGLGRDALAQRIHVTERKVLAIEAELNEVLRASVPDSMKLSSILELQRRGAEPFRELQALRKAEWLTDGLRELFSDLVPALRQGDPQVIEKSSRAYAWLARVHQSNPGIRTEYRSRGFNRDWDADSLRKLLNPNEKNPAKPAGDPHVYFAPIRRALWQALEPAFNSPDRGRVLSRLYKVITDYERELFPDVASYSRQDIDIGRVNLELLKRVQAEFKNLG